MTTVKSSVGEGDHYQNHPPIDAGSDSGSLADISTKIANRLKEECQPRWIKNVPRDLHPLPPFLPKQEWTRLGDAIKHSEQPTCAHIPGDKWISLRCDGTGFSKLTKRLQKEGVFSGTGYSNDFAACMQETCKELMVKFEAKCGYTQSDEMTILIPPASVARGEQQPHKYNGRIAKLCSLAAATVTAKFNFELMALCHRKQIKNVNKLLGSSLPTFDCRVGVYDSEQEALSLILWRAYDCGINAVSDAVYKSGIAGAKQVLRLPTEQKLPWLMKNNLLPLPAHQREGTLWVKRKRTGSATNKITGELVTYVRGRIEKVEGNVLQLYKEDALFPQDEALPERQEDNKRYS